MLNIKIVTYTHFVTAGVYILLIIAGLISVFISPELYENFLFTLMYMFTNILFIFIVYMNLVIARQILKGHLATLQSWSLIIITSFPVLVIANNLLMGLIG